MSGSLTDATPFARPSAAVTFATAAALAGSVILWPSGTEKTTVAVAAFWELKRAWSRS